MSLHMLKNASIIQNVFLCQDGLEAGIQHVFCIMRAVELAQCQLMWCAPCTPEFGILWKLPKTLLNYGQSFFASKLISFHISISLILGWKIFSYKSNRYYIVIERKLSGTYFAGTLMLWAIAMEISMHTGVQLMVYMVCREDLFGIGLIRWAPRCTPFTLYLKSPELGCNLSK